MQDIIKFLTEMFKNSIYVVFDIVFDITFNCVKISPIVLLFFFVDFLLSTVGFTWYVAILGVVCLLTLIKFIVNYFLGGE